MPTFPFGRTPRGYLVYDATGHVFFQAHRPDAMDSLRTANERDAPAQITSALADGYAAYFGTYEIDSTRRTVTHHLEGEFPMRRGAYEVATPFRLRADTLTLGIESLRAWTFVRVR